MSRHGLWLVLAGCLAVNLHAQDSKQDEQWLLAKYDANGDRVISIDEVEEKRKQAFARMDFDLDGDVSFEEYERLDRERRNLLLQARFVKLDSNQDGRLTGQEYASYLGSFDRMDQNGDGQVSASEMTQSKDSDEALKEEADACLLWFCVRKNMW